MIRLPNEKNQIAIVGMNGSGKTVAALWHLSRANFDKQPWIIFDYKGDDEIGSIDRAEYIGVGEIPKRSGIYIVQPLASEDESVDSYLDSIRLKERIGIYVDEGYMMPFEKNGYYGLKNLLTQGRSKKIGRILISQRPSWVSRFTFSEANFLQVYHLSDRRDHATAGGFIRGYSGDLDLKDYHSWYYDVGMRSTVLLKPVPKPEISLQVIDDRLKPRRKIL